VHGCEGDRRADAFVDCKVPDVEVVEWETTGSSVLAHLRQSAWDDATWFQVLRVEGGLIRRLEDHPTREAALAAMGDVEA
jgi:hypothetical protein